MRIYTMIGGLDGVGKSSLTGVLVGEHNDLGIVVDTDSLTAKQGGDKLKGGKEAIRIINDCLEKGVNFTQETTLSGRKTLHTINSAREKDYYIRLYYVGISSAEESISRISNRVRKGGHNIPTEDVRRRYGKRFEDLINILPYCDFLIVTRCISMITRTALSMLESIGTAISFSAVIMFPNGLNF